jgi:hypothetical protein
MRSQIYWRVAPTTNATAAAIESLISVQTSLLDSCPTLVSSSELVVGSAFRLQGAGFESTVEIAAAARGTTFDHSAEPGGFLFRLEHDVSYAELVHPADCERSRVEIDGAGRARLSHELFPSRLEKGVILRARVLGVLLPRAGDREAAAKHFAAFLAADLPLTT